MPEFVAVIMPLQLDPVLAKTAEEFKLDPLSNYDKQFLY
tara:strand:+ start:297 stop:413 length:117 start_codon:yes stop_codon:yes gene_type:complete